MSTRPQSIELMQDNTLRLLERITNSREEGRLFLEPDSVPKARAQELVNDIQLVTNSSRHPPNITNMFTRSG
jgi:hypothetical protein